MFGGEVRLLQSYLTAYPLFLPKFNKNSNIFLLQQFCSHQPTIALPWLRKINNARDNLRRSPKVLRTSEFPARGRYKSYNFHMIL